MQEIALIESKSLRDENAGRIEVLDQFGFNIQVQYVTIKEVARFYDVSKDTVEKIAERHRDELEIDGLRNFSYAEILENAQFRQVVGIEISPHGCRGLTPRCVLRVGMLLRDSPKAKEIRTAVLDTVGKAAAITAQAAPHPLSQTSMARIAIEDTLAIAHMFRCPEHIAQVEAIHQAQLLTGLNYAPLLLAAPAQDNILEEEVMLEPSRIGYRLGLEGEKRQVGSRINKFIASQCGWQYRQNGDWIPTEEGKKYCTRHHWCENGTEGYNLKWNFQAVEAKWREIFRPGLIPPQPYGVRGASPASGSTPGTATMSR